MRFASSPRWITTAAAHFALWAIAITAIFGRPTAASAEPLNLPAWVKPGAQLVFYQAKTGTGGAGSNYLLVDILQILPEGILVAEGGLGEVTTPGMQGLYLASGSPKLLDPLTIQSGMGYFIPLDQMATARSGNGVFVSLEPWRTDDGQTYNAFLRTIVNGSRTTYRNKNDPKQILFREDARSITQQAYDTQTGILLNDLARQYEDATGFNKDNQPTNNRTRLAVGVRTAFRNLRQLNGPWIGQQWPAWTQTVQQLHYTGTQSVFTPGTFGGNNRWDMPAQMTFDVKERGQGWVAGISTFSVQNPRSGQVQQVPGPNVESVNSLGGLWMSPDALRAIADQAARNNGVVDIEPITKTVTSAQRQGDTVLIMVQSSGGDRTTSYYDLQRGVMQRVVTEKKIQQHVIDLRLQNMQ
ncbi:MAG: hypothetical protein AAF750_06100 [Planctomycetota bacterium]